MSLVESKRVIKGNPEGAAETTTHLNGTTQRETMVTLKETLINGQLSAEPSANASGMYVLDQGTG